MKSIPAVLNTLFYELKIPEIKLLINTVLVALIRNTKFDQYYLICV